jgi:L-lactate dehydrogenase (cytochrome)
MNILRKFPCTNDMRKAAATRVPRFAFDYLSGGIGVGKSLQHNRDVLDGVKLLPRYLVSDADHPDCSTTLLGQKFDRPFGVAPIGLGGLIWPGAAQFLAAAAKEHNIPFCLSGFATVKMEKIAEIAGQHAWYQHYMCADEEVNRAFFKRAGDCGFRNLIITVDIPTATRRDHDIRNGLSVPPRFNLQTLYQVATHPRWAFETLGMGIPRFQNYTHLMPKRANLDKVGFYLQELIEGHVSPERLKMVRDYWPHNLIVKGILGAEDASKCKEIGVQALVVSNHGGRQLDAAHSALEKIPEIRAVVGSEMPLIADGGVMTGLDVIRYLASGADFVLAGRAFMYAVGAMGKPGAGHAMDVLFEEFECTMAQLGCARTGDLPNFLYRP